MPTFSQHLLQFIFPITCAGCGRGLPADDYYRICPDCQLSIKVIGKFFCSKCGAYMPDGGEHCYHCLKNPRYHFEFIRSAGVYTGITKDLIHKFKYHNKDYLCRFLCRLLIKTVEAYPELEDVDYVMPVPMHWFKKFRRGYNQTELLAKIVSKHFKKPLLTDNLYRRKLNRAQVGLAREMRLENVRECFGVSHPESIKKKSILLIDDVCTTGATIEECSKVLRKSGAKKVYGLTVARD